MTKRDDVIRKIMRSLNGSVDTLSDLSRDPPIVAIANLERNGDLSREGLKGVRIESMKLATSMNEYRREYWKLEMLIKQSFVDILKKAGYLPGRSLEVESLRNALPEALIKDDERIWIYSYDHYIHKIAENVGRPADEAPTGKEAWSMLRSRFDRRIEKIVYRANQIIPEIFYLKARLSSLVGTETSDLDMIRVRRPMVSKVERPIKKVIVIKRPLPIPRKGRRPRKRILKRPKIQVIGPEEA